MEIKREHIPVIRPFLRRLFSRKVAYAIVLVLLAILFVAGCLVGLVLGGFFGPLGKLGQSAASLAVDQGLKKPLNDLRNAVTGLIAQNVGLPANYAATFVTGREEIAIDIKEKDFFKIEAKRQEALATGILVTSDADYVPAEIRYKNQTIKVDLRLKGDWPDHWAGSKWSFRIKVKGNDTLFGLKKFSIQDPLVRNNLNEWVYQKALQREGVDTVQYRFIGVTLNGKYMGIYALEQSFDDIIAEYNGEEDGPIMIFNDKFLWEYRKTLLKVHIDGGEGYQGLDQDSYLSSEVSAFTLNRLLRDNVSREQFNEAKDMLELYRNGSLTTSQVFDVDKLAKYKAISALMGGTHGTIWHNLRFYFNPETHKLEPIGYDSNAGALIDDLYIDLHIAPDDDPAFMAAYDRELERIAQPGYIDELFRALEPELGRNVSILRCDDPFYVYTGDYILRNQKYIQLKLDPTRALNAYFYNTTAEGHLYLEIGNVQDLPIEVLNVTCRGATVFQPTGGPYLLKSRALMTPVSYDKVGFNLPPGYNWSESDLANMTVNFRLLGTSRLLNESVSCWQRLSGDPDVSVLLTQRTDLARYNFLSVDEDTHTIRIKAGNWSIGEPVIIPAGYIVVGGEGTRLDLVNGSSVLSYSPLELLGSEQLPIVVTSSDRTGKGISVLDVNHTSVLSYVTFDNLSAPYYGVDYPPGTVTFYRSLASLDHCCFYDNREGDNMLGIYWSSFEITNTLFKNARQDAVGIESSDGNIARSSFLGCGLNGLNLSASTVLVSDCLIDGANGSGVRADAQSHARVAASRIFNSRAGIVSLGMSEVSADNIVLDSDDYGLVAQEGSRSPSPARITASEITTSNVTEPYYVEKGSLLTVDDQAIAARAGGDAPAL